MSDDPIATLFQPRCVAVIGASTDARKPGGRVLRYLQQHFEGEVLGVNPRAEGMAASLEATGRTPDVALIAVPAASVATEIQACARAGVRCAIVLSAGFAETGPEGQRLQEEIGRIARDSGVRVFGPNCMGVCGPARGYYATFTAVIAQGLPSAGPVAMVSQSGAVGTHVLSLLRDSGVGLSWWAAAGNQMDLDVADCIAFFVRDPATRVIVTCMEGCPDGDKLQRALHAAREAGKPVIALKLGRTAAGATAASTHTGSLVGSHACFEAVFARHGVLVARGFEELVDLATACAGGVYPLGSRLGIASISGGAAVLMADDATDAGLELPALPVAAQDRLRAMAPLGATRNPCDTTATAMVQPGLLQAFVDELLCCDDIDTAVLFLSNAGREPELIAHLRPGLAEARQRHPDKPVALVVGTTESMRAQLRADGFVLYEDPSRAIRGLAGLARFARAQRTPPRAPGGHALPEVEAPPAGDERSSLQWLSAQGVPVVATALATTAAEAVAAARRLGHPVALKIASPQIAHKSDVGGVALNLADDAAVALAFDQVVSSAQRAVPAAHIDGVVVAPMVRGGVELILGARHDAIFGPMVMVGMGGVFVETVRDTVLRVAPIDADEAREMILGLKGAPLLTGARGRPPLDVDAAAASLAALSRAIAAARGRVAEIDVNPFVVLPQGGLALDALVVAGEAAAADTQAAAH